MNSIQALILGAVQGLTEFLPVSSSGHLVLFQRLFGLKEGVLVFDIAVHLSTLLAVIAVFWKDILGIFKKPLGKLTWLIVVGTIPAVVFGLAFKHFIERLFETGKTLGLEFIATGVILWLAEAIVSKNKKLEETSASDAICIGTAQAVAILPAVSRSGLTIAGALFRGLNREFAAKFSFLLSIPAILGAAVLDIPDATKMLKSSGTIGVSLLPLILGMAAALVFGWIAIRWMLRVLSKGSLRGFAVYVFSIGLLVLLEQIFIGRIFSPLW
jgi:undecaprenyl-diphosphatase